MAKYEGLVPAGKHPKAEVKYSPKDPALQTVQETVELTQRC